MGRPKMSVKEKRVTISITLNPATIKLLKSVGKKSIFIEELILKKLKKK